MTVAEMTLDVISNNLANAATTGFKRDAVVFNEAMEKVLRSEAGDGKEIGTLGSGPGVKAVATDFAQGSLVATGNPLDLALTSADGMFAVRTPDGIKYTRDGAFGTNADGLLVDKNGYPVLDDRENEITVTGGKLEINDSGTVSVNGAEVATLGIYKGQFTKQGLGLYSSSGAQVVDPNQVKVSQGFIESSNVNPIEEMVQMIKLNRAFEMAQKSATSQDESTQQLIQGLLG